MDDLPEIRKQRKLLPLNDPRVTSLVLTVLATVWVVVSFLVVSNAMYRWTSLAVAVSLLATAIIVYLRYNPSSSIHKYHTAIVETLLRSEAIPLAILDRTGQVVEMNEASSRMLGYQRTEVIGEPIMRMIDPGSRSQLQESLDGALGGETNQSNINITHRSGFPLNYRLFVLQ